MEMLKRGKSSVLTLAEKCKNVLASNWQGNLNTIKSEGQGSKDEIYTSKVKYFVKKGNPYLWVPAEELHNVNISIDERASFAVTSPFPGPLAHIFRSINKLPARVALVGDVARLGDEKAKIAAKSLKETLLADQKTVEESSYALFGILSSSHLDSTSQSNLQDLLQGDIQYSVYKFNLSSCLYFDINGKAHEVKVEDIEKSKTDHVARFSMGLIDGINQSEIRRQALVLFCIAFENENAKDAFVLSVDRKGFDVLAKIMGSENADGSREYHWKELRFTFTQVASDVETFCQQLLKLEEEALKKISSMSGL